MAIAFITGANGFVGRMLCTQMMAQGWQVRGAIRSIDKADSLPSGVIGICIGSGASNTDWSKALDGVNTIVHLAARVHMMKDSIADPLAAFRHVNVDYTERLARMAATAGVHRFVFISSVKVNGEESPVPYTEQNIPSPQDAYAVSKWEAEQALQKVAGETGLEVVILRPPLVYGPGVKANFFQLFEVVHRRIPLPLLNVVNRRSFIYLDNLVDAIIKVINHPKARGQTYLVSDGDDVSSPELIRRVAAALGQQARLIPFPIFLIRLMGTLAGKSSSVSRLLGSLAVDGLKIRQELGWTPPHSMAHGLKETADWYLRYVKMKE